MISKKQKYTNYFILFFFSAFITLLNYSYGSFDHIEQLPIIFKHIDSNYLVNDFFVQANLDYSPRFFYSEFIVFLHKIISLPFLFFIGTFFFNFLLGYSIYKIVIKYSSQKAGIIVCALLMSLPTIKLGGDNLLYNSMFTPTSMAFPLSIFAFYNLIYNRHLIAFLTIGFVSLMHPLIGLEYGMIYFTIVILMDKHNKSILKNIPQYFKYVFILLAFLTPNIIVYLKSNNTLTTEQFISIIGYFRHPHHYILSSIIDTKEVLIFSIIVFSSVLFYKELQQDLSKSFKIVLKFAFGLMFFIPIINWLFIEVFPNKLITTLQLLRVLSFSKLLYIVILGLYILKCIEQNKISKYILLCLIVFSLIFISEYSLLKTTMTMLIFGFIIVLIYTNKKNWVFGYSLAVLILFITFNNFQIGLFDNYNKDYFSFTKLNPSKDDLNSFLNKNTKEDQLFLTPHDFGFIRIYAKRAIVVDFKAFPFQNEAMLEWYHRIEAIYGTNTDNFKFNYTNLTDEKITTLYQKYKFDFAILHKETKTQYEVVYQNDQYKIVALSSAKKI